jgi:hypothetical protein
MLKGVTLSLTLWIKEKIMLLEHKNWKRPERNIIVIGFLEGCFLVVRNDFVADRFLIDLLCERNIAFARAI